MVPHLRAHLGPACVDRRQAHRARRQCRALPDPAATAGKIWRGRHRRVAILFARARALSRPAADARRPRSVRGHHWQSELRPPAAQRHLLQRRRCRLRLSDRASRLQTRQHHRFAGCKEGRLRTRVRRGTRHRRGACPSRRSQARHEDRGLLLGAWRDRRDADRNLSPSCGRRALPGGRWWLQARNALRQSRQAQGELGAGLARDRVRAGSRRLRAAAQFARDREERLAARTRCRF